jgi:hypothetical protein
MAEVLLLPEPHKLMNWRLRPMIVTTIMGRVWGIYSAVILRSHCTIRAGSSNSDASGSLISRSTFAADREGSLSVLQTHLKRFLKLYF